MKNILNSLLDIKNRLPCRNIARKKIGKKNSKKLKAIFRAKQKPFG